MWKDLTLQEKAEIMKMSVANGVTDINDIQQLYDDSVGHQLKEGGNKTNLGIIDAILTKHGVNYIKTSGYRGPNSKIGKQGSRSGHARTLSDGSSAAIDIVPGPGSSWNKLYAQMSTPEVRADLARYGLDILDETDAATMKKTGATGKHFHVGKGIKGQQGMGVFVNQNNPIIASYNRVYGAPKRALDSTLYYNPMENLKWESPEKKIQQSPWYNTITNVAGVEDFNLPTLDNRPTKSMPEEPYIPDMSEIVPSFTYLPDKQAPVSVTPKLPIYDSINLNLLDAPYLLFDKI